MSENQQNWIAWARTFHRWGVSKPAASLLEAAGSLSILLAQLLYLSEPLLSGAVSAGSINDFAQVLENPADRQEFISLLREASTSGADA